MKFFLKLTNVELFFLFILPIALSIIFCPDAYQPFLNSILNSCFFLNFIGWLYSVGNEFGKRKYNNSKQLILFRISIIVYSFSIIFLSFKDFNGINIEAPLVFLTIILVLSSVFYSLYFATKVMVSEEKQRKVSFREHQIECFLFFVFFIGVWVLQPRINRLA
jgi:uncharacterized membrane protein